MKRFVWSMILVLTIMLAACGSPTPSAVSPTTPAPVATVNAPSSDIVVASAVASPVQVTRLGFIISALVKEITVKEGDKVQAGQSLIVLDTPDLEFAATAAEAAYRSASVNEELQNADFIKVINERTGHFYRVPLAKELHQIAQAQVVRSQAALDIAKATLSLSTLTAPFDGVVASINVIPGELVQANQVVLTLATLNDLQIKTTDLGERDIARVKIGQSVSVHISALDVTVNGKVTLISPVSETVGGDVVFPVTIELDEQPVGLLWGMTAEVQIKTIP